MIDDSVPEPLIFRVYIISGVLLAAVLYCSIDVLPKATDDKVAAVEVNVASNCAAILPSSKSSNCT